ncbi:hypothetical protein RBH29_04730 [Herbivorax sp. ANBcel31]|uniref:hypothetical protein n=1 Tax=Herbivorax sp. ANBcel31 TaxID=3069754 RepID=UPI0027B77E09|nr:hypothetical protein [Herbivorax sp. ANBcel31]MDQ2085739.1 hypothetical protein [Herbivorax sp. ANBcel31]
MNQDFMKKYQDYYIFIFLAIFTSITVGLLLLDISFRFLFVADYMINDFLDVLQYIVIAVYSIVFATIVK